MDMKGILIFPGYARSWVELGFVILSITLICISCFFKYYKSGKYKKEKKASLVITTIISIVTVLFNFALPMFSINGFNKLSGFGQYYDGLLVNGRFHDVIMYDEMSERLVNTGKSTFIYRNGDRYTGEWVNGNRHGRGIFETELYTYEGYYSSDAIIFHGRFSIKDSYMEFYYETLPDGTWEVTVHNAEDDELGYGIYRHLLDKYGLSLEGKGRWMKYTEGGNLVPVLNGVFDYESAEFNGILAVYNAKDNVYLIQEGRFIRWELSVNQPESFKLYEGMDYFLANSQWQRTPVSEGNHIYEKTVNVEADEVPVL